MPTFDELPVWASICLLLGGVLLALIVVRLSGSEKYHRKTPDGWKVFIAFVLSQAVFSFFLPLVSAMNFLPRVLPPTGAEIAEYAGDAVGILWSVASGITVCMGLMPRNGLGTGFGVLSYLIMNGMSFAFLIQMVQNGQRLSMLLYAGSVAIGLIAFLLAFQRRRASAQKKRKRN